MDNKFGYSFIETCKIKNIFRADELSVEAVCDFFINAVDEQIYVVDSQMLIGIISPGDLHRYLSGKCVNFYNDHFTVLEDIDYERAEKLFSERKKMYTIPVIKNDKWIGIIDSKRKKTDEEWREIKRDASSQKDSYIGGEYIYKQLAETVQWYKDHGVIFCPFILTARYHMFPQSTQVQFKKKYSYPNADMSVMSENEQRKFLGDKYSNTYISDYMECYRGITGYIKNGISYYNDYESKYINIKNSHRIISNAPSGAKHRIIIIGPCLAFGAYVSDDETIGYYLQQIVSNNYGDKYEVMVYARRGGLGIDLLVSEPVQRGDIIIYFAIEKASVEAVKRLDGVKVTDFTSVFLKTENVEDYIFNSIVHCNYILNQKVAEFVFSEIALDDIPQKYSVEERIAKQNYYIGYEIFNSFDLLRLKYLSDEIMNPNRTRGGVVMNCNPFTKGHRYLLEQALNKVDYLFVFIVQENRSHFSYQDRINMVRIGTSDLQDRIRILPSGRYIISTETFRQYFEKDKEIEQIESTEYDVRIFGEVVCKKLNITYRFVGEEKRDIVTNAYNQTMKKVLPQYGIEVIEIPRVKDNEGEDISASVLRQRIKNKESIDGLVMEDVKKYLDKIHPGVC